jgi:DNA-binding transcriptional regulator YhcF (GntR family)
MAEPRYRQIAKDLREQIKTGRIAPDGPRPTGLGFRDRYNASRNTARDAMKGLTADIKGLTADRVVTAKSGPGIFAAEGAAVFAVTLSVSAETGPSVVESAVELAEIARRGRRPWASGPRVEVPSASPNMAPQLPRRGRRAAVKRGKEQVFDLPEDVTVPVVTVVTAPATARAPQARPPSGRPQPCSPPTASGSSSTRATCHGTARRWSITSTSRRPAGNDARARRTMRYAIRRLRRPVRYRTLWHTLLGACPVTVPLPSSRRMARQMVKKAPNRTPKTTAVTSENAMRVVMKLAMTVSSLPSRDGSAGPRCRPDSGLTHSAE